MSEAKITRINSKIGSESAPEMAAVELGVLTFPEATGNDVWGVYVPLQGMAFMFYKLAELKESDVAALKNRRFVLEYKNSDLLGSSVAPYTEQERARHTEELERNLLVSAHNLFCKRGHKECDCDPRIFTDPNEFPEYLDILDADEITDES